MRQRAGLVLFDSAPKPEEPDGEWDGSSWVPFGLIREVVAIAGGSAAGTDSSLVAAGLFRKVSEKLFRPQWGLLVSGGTATGPTIRNLFREADVITESYRWEYGAFPRTREFEPHRDLDDRIFENFDDEVLRNPTGGWPGPFYMPGDHDGCVCDFVPVLTRADGSPVEYLKLSEMRGGVPEDKEG